MHILNRAIWLSLLLPLCLSACNHPIFCSEKVLSAVASGNYFNDSKSFVDLILKVPVNEALKIFENKGVSEFLSTCFQSSESILKPTKLKDLKQFPKSFEKIKNKDMLEFAMDLNKRWEDLARVVDLETKSDCGNSSDCSSFLYEMNQRTIIIPGGRFKQAYYWDTYWIIKGLLECEMFDTAETLVRNFAIIIQKYGFIPNGLRIYYLNRSQPPFFFKMVKQIIQKLRIYGLRDKADLLEQQMYPILLQEYDYWRKTHTTNVTLNAKIFQLNIYKADTQLARPESFREDMNTVADVTDLTKKAYILSALSSMAESGWDFSSRWLTDSKDLKTSVISQIIPSDLNTLMALFESYLLGLSFTYKRMDLVDYFWQKVQMRKEYFQIIKREGRFPDYHINQPKRQLFTIYPTDFFPFFVLPEAIILPDLFKNKVNPSASGVNTGQQWDLPNVWAPNNWILHEVTESSVSKKFGQEWVRTVYCSWKKTGNIYEKYRWDEVGERGQGGQYTVQTGFGWSNGLALYYLTLYGETIRVESCN